MKEARRLLVCFLQDHPILRTSDPNKLMQMLEFYFHREENAHFLDKDENQIPEWQLPYRRLKYISEVNEENQQKQNIGLVKETEDDEEEEKEKQLENGKNEPEKEEPKISENHDDEEEKPEKEEPKIAENHDVEAPRMEENVHHDQKENVIGALLNLQKQLNQMIDSMDKLDEINRYFEKNLPEKLESFSRLYERFGQLLKEYLRTHDPNLMIEVKKMNEQIIDSYEKICQQNSDFLKHMDYDETAGIVVYGEEEEDFNEEEEPIQPTYETDTHRVYEHKEGNRKLIISVDKKHEQPKGYIGLMKNLPQDFKLKGGAPPKKKSQPKEEKPEEEEKPKPNPFHEKYEKEHEMKNQITSLQKQIFDQQKTIEDLKNQNDELLAEIKEIKDAYYKLAEEKNQERKKAEERIKKLQSDYNLQQKTVKELTFQISCLQPETNKQLSFDSQEGALEQINSTSITKAEYFKPFTLESLLQQIDQQHQKSLERYFLPKDLTPEQYEKRIDELECMKGHPTKEEIDEACKDIPKEDYEVVDCYSSEPGFFKTKIIHVQELREKRIQEMIQIRNQQIQKEIEYLRKDMERAKIEYPIYLEKRERLIARYPKSNDMIIHNLTEDLFQEISKVQEDDIDSISKCFVEKMKPICPIDKDYSNQLFTLYKNKSGKLTRSTITNFYQNIQQLLINLIQQIIAKNSSNQYYYIEEQIRKVFCDYTIPYFTCSINKFCQIKIDELIPIKDPMSNIQNVKPYAEERLEIFNQFLKDEVPIFLELSGHFCYTFSLDQISSVLIKHGFHLIEPINTDNVLDPLIFLLGRYAPCVYEEMQEKLHIKDPNEVKYYWKAIPTVFKPDEVQTGPSVQKPDESQTKASIIEDLDEVQTGPIIEEPDEPTFQKKPTISQPFNTPKFQTKAPTSQQEVNEQTFQAFLANVPDEWIDVKILTDSYNKFFHQNITTRSFGMLELVKKNFTKNPNNFVDGHRVILYKKN